MPAAHPLKFLMAASAVTACTWSNAQQVAVDRVVVLDANFAVVSKLESAQQVLEFTEIWQSKVKQPFSTSRLDQKTFTFNLDVKAAQGGGRWLYRADGYICKLAHNEQPVYKVQDPKRFNKLLGVGP